GFRSRNPKMKKNFYQRNVVVSFSGPAAEYRVNKWLVHIDSDVEAIAYGLRELLPRKMQYINGVLNYGEHWGDFWALVCILAIISDRKRAITELDEFPGLAKIDVSIFDTLWPFAQQAHAILGACWSSVEEIAQHLLKVGSITGPQIESIFSGVTQRATAL